LTHADAHLPLLFGDARLLRRALGNLLNNAAHYPEVELGARFDAANFVLEVRDCGPGIPATHVDDIFLPFFQCDHRPAGGNGLGLAIVKRIVEAHCGRVELETSSHGSIFRLVLPRTD